MVRDFSNEAEQNMLGIVDQVESEKWCDVTDWFGDRWYDFRDLIHTLDIDQYMNRINDYHKIVIDKNNASKDDIRKIFEAVRAVDDQYTTRFAACQNRLEAYKTLVDSLAALIGSGSTDSEQILSIFNGQYKTFSDGEEILAAISQDGLQESDLEGKTDGELKTILDNLGKTLVVLVPDVKLGTKLEIPVGPGLTFYYSTSGKIDGGNDSYDVNFILEDHKMKFKNADVSYKTDGILKVGGKAGTDNPGEISVEAPNSSVTFNVDGKCESSGTMKVGDTTYEVKIEFSAAELVAEESVTTEFDGGSVTTTIGLKRENNKWQPLPEPVPVDVPNTVSLPSFDVDWGTVAVVGGTIVLIGVGIALAPSTGGVSLVLCGA